jgi:DNA-binding transcriptional MerR regulator
VSEDARPVYSIGAVSRMLSIAPATLRSWEGRYGLVVPQRTEGGHRLFSRDQVEHLRFVQARLAEGAHASDAHRLLAELLGAAEPVATVPTGGVATGGDRPVILIAERDPYAAEISAFFLRSEGYEVVVSLSAEDAAHRFTTLSPVLVVVELMISGGVGGDLCRELKAQSEAPVVTVSSLEAGDDALGAGADVFLSKPLDRAELVSTVNDLFGQSTPAAGLPAASEQA